MNSRKVGVFIGLVLALTLGLVVFTGSKSTSKAAMAVCTVPGTHATIQSAVSDVTCTTINVGPGTYTENVTITHTLTLNGTRAGTDARGRAGAETIVNGANPVGSNPVISIQAADVRVDGFTLKNTITVNAAIGVAVKNSGTNAVITNNIFDGIIATSPASNGNATAQAVYLEAGPDGVSITQNDMKNIECARSGKGVLIGDAGSTNPSVNVTVQDNWISAVTTTTRGAYGVQVNNGNGSTSNTGLTVTNNDINNLTGGGWVHAIAFETNTPGVVVEGNTISSLTAPAPPSAVWFEANPSFGTAEVHNNNFNLPSTQYGILVDPPLSTSFPTLNVDGACNWWNSPSGPTAASNTGGTGAAVGPNVTYSPWLNAPAPGAICGTIPTNKNQCKDGGWMNLFRADGSGFKNQGDCIQYVNTGK